MLVDRAKNIEIDYTYALSKSSSELLHTFRAPICLHNYNSMQFLQCVQRKISCFDGKLLFHNNLHPFLQKLFAKRYNDITLY